MLRASGAKSLTCSAEQYSRTGECLPSLHWLPLSRFLSLPAEELPLDEQEAEENFDLSLIAALEIDVVPYIGEACVPDHWKRA